MYALIANPSCYTSMLPTPTVYNQWVSLSIARNKKSMKNSPRLWVNKYLAVLVLPKLYSGYSDCLICLTLYWGFNLGPPGPEADDIQMCHHALMENNNFELSCFGGKCCWFKLTRHQSINFKSNNFIPCERSE